jgi:hypothetical protein
MSAAVLAPLLLAGALAAEGLRLVPEVLRVDAAGEGVRAGGQDVAPAGGMGAERVDAAAPRSGPGSLDAGTGAASLPAVQGDAAAPADGWAPPGAGVPLGADAPAARGAAARGAPLRSGERLRFVVRYVHEGPPPPAAVVVDAPLPAWARYVEGSAQGGAAVEFSCDGIEFADAASLRCAASGDAAPVADDYRAIRFRLPDGLVAGSGGAVAYDVFVR